MQIYQEMSDDLARLIALRLKLGAAPLPVLLRRLGRRAPRVVRRDLAQVAAAADLGRHPKLAARIDAAAVQAAHDRAARWLRAFDWEARQAQARRRLRAGLACKLLLVLVIGITLLAWSGAIGPEASAG